MTAPADLTAFAARVITITKRLQERQAKDLADWANLYRLLGRAQQAAEAGDLAEFRRRLNRAADAEYALLLDCEATGELIEKLDSEVQS